MKKKKKKKLVSELELSRYVDLSDISKATLKNNKNKEVVASTNKFELKQGDNSEKEARLLNLLTYIQ